MNTDKDVEDVKKFNECIADIEFYEIPHRGIEMYVKIKPMKLMETLEWLHGEEHWSMTKREIDEFYMKKANKSKNENFNFGLYMRGDSNGLHKIKVYPKTEMITFTEYGLHYVCQHILDIFPRYIKGCLMDVYKPMNVGLLFSKPKKGEEGLVMMVTSADVHNGFMLTYETIHKKFKDSFVKWILYCKEKNTHSSQ